MDGLFTLAVAACLSGRVVYQPACSITPAMEERPGRGSNAFSRLGRFTAGRKFVEGRLVFICKALADPPLGGVQIHEGGVVYAIQAAKASFQIPVP